MLYRFFRKRISEFKLKEDNTMRINGFSGTNTQTGTMGMTQGNDSVSKNIQNQIANAQQKQQDLSSNEEMSLEYKMKKRQEIQQELNNLNQQLRQHQIIACILACDNPVSFFLEVLLVPATISSIDDEFLLCCSFLCSIWCCLNC